MNLTDFLLARIAEDEEHPREAKRRIIRRITEGCGHPYIGAWCAECDWILNDLALPYASHPDYCEEWRL